MQSLVATAEDLTSGVTVYIPARLISQCLTLHLFFSLSFFNTPQHYRFGVRTSSLAADATWSPPDGQMWTESDYEAQLKKLESEAEERMDAKINELMSKIESTGTSGN